MLRNAYLALSASLLKPGTRFCVPTQVFPERVSLESPAVEVMTDLNCVCAVVIGPTNTVDEAHKKMRQRRVRLLFVVDESQKITGLITATDILGEKPMKVIAQRGCSHQEILVSDIMTHQAQLEVLEMGDVRSAKVGQIVATLVAAGRQHAMVIEHGAHGEDIVRGLFSATQIARQLGMTIQTTEVARTVSEIVSLLAA